MTLLLAALAPIVSKAADFGVADWGMTRDQVKQLETRANLTPFSATDYLIYEVSLTGVDRTRLIYQFQAGRLTQGRFMFFPDNALDFNRSTHHYRQVLQMMIAQYGEPRLNQQLHRSAPAMSVNSLNVANELAADRLILKSQWRSATALIVHQLAWNENRPHHQLHYQAIAPIPANTAEPSF